MIELDRIGVRIGSFILHNIALKVPTGAYAVLMGPTGAGKTTLLEVVAGLRKPNEGRVLVNERDVTGLRPGERNIGYVPQDGALFPTMTVADHLNFAPKLRGWPASRITARVAELADRLGIRHLLDRHPAGLSGGERQRVALGRALSFDPPVLLLDEPLSSLDELTREGLAELLVELHREHRPTVLHVTHSRAEARRLGEVVFELKGGGVCGGGERAE